MNRRKLLFFCSSALLFSLAGCTSRREKPLAMQEVPPLSPAPPGTFRDVNPRFSHKGKRIAFVRTYPDRTQALFTSDPALKTLHQEREAEIVLPDRPYAPGRDTLVSPDTIAWSPDDKKLAFTRAVWFDFGGTENFPGTELWTLDVETGQVFPLAGRPTKYKGSFFFYKNPVWSEDGKRVAFTGEGLGGQRAIFIRHLDLVEADDVAPRFDKFEDSDFAVWEPPSVSGKAKSESSSLIFRQGIRRAPYSPLTETIRRLRPSASTPQDTGELWRLSTHEAQRQVFTRTKKGQSVIPRLGQLTPSPSGKRIAFVLIPDALDLKKAELWTMHRDGLYPKRVSPLGVGAFAPTWIDKDTLAFLSPHQQKFRVKTLSVETGKTRTLGEIETADCDWSPDFSTLVYASSSHKGGVGLKVLRVRGRKMLSVKR
ncbi:MAG: PD40 domain-containing protein [Chthonomonadaceae bacterium]|nr:PD40 domain-containing protein [Chthonomonadaceae bacterium]